MRSRRWGVVWLALTGLFAYAAARGVDVDELRDALASANAWWLVPATVVLGVSIALRALRWQLLFPPESRPPLAPVTRSLLIGYLFNNVLPARAGEAARIVALNRGAGVSRAQALGTVLLERALDVVGLIVVLLAVAIWLPEVGWLRAAVALAVVVVVLTGAAVLLARFGDRPVRRLVRPLGSLPFLSAARVETAGANVTEGLVALRRPRLAAMALALTVLSWLVMAVSVWLVMPAFDLGLSPAAAVLVLVATGFGAVIPSGPAGVGVFEASVVVALGAYDIGGAQALSYALVLHAVNFFPFLVAGAIALRTAARAAP